jgi:hypothetical protein
MRILIVVPEQDRISGNWVTATRFRDRPTTGAALSGAHSGLCPRRHHPVTRLPFRKTVVEGDSRPQAPNGRLAHRHRH